MRHNAPVLAEALSDLEASSGFSALEVARAGEAFWVGFFAPLGYLTLGPLLLLNPWVERQGLARALLELRLARGLLFLLFPFLPRQAPLLALHSYPLIALTDLAVVAWAPTCGRCGAGPCRGRAWPQASPLSGPSSTGLGPWGA